MNPAPPMPAPVAAAFAAFPNSARTTLQALRERILALAAEADVGPLTETLKWGQPAYLTEASKAGTTLRLGLLTDQPAVFFNCQTSLVDGYRRDFPEAFTYSGNRALLIGDGFDPAALDQCLMRALTYHRAKRRTRP